jgi:transketolase
MSALPNMAILAPCDPLETEAAVRVCVEERNGPTYLRLGKAGEPNLTTEAPAPFRFGRLRQIKEGRDLCILSFGPNLKMGLEVAAEVERKRGRSTSVYNCHTLKPLDVQGIARCLNQYPEVIVIEEHSERGGLAAQVKQIAWDHKAGCRLYTFSLKDEFIHFFGTHADILDAHGLSARRICAAVGAD